MASRTNSRSKSRVNSRSRTNSVRQGIGSSVAGVVKGLGSSVRSGLNSIKNTLTPNRSGGSSSANRNTASVLNSNRIATSSPATRGGLDFSNQNSVLNSPSVRQLNQTNALQRAQKSQREQQVLATGLAGTTGTSRRSQYERTPQSPLPASNFMTVNRSTPQSPLPASNFMTQGSGLRDGRIMNRSNSTSRDGRINDRTDFSTPVNTQGSPSGNDTTTPVAPRETTTYGFSGQRNDIGQDNLSTLQARLVELQKRKSEIEQAANDAVITPDEQDIEEEKLLREEERANREYERLLRESPEEQSANQAIDALAAQEAALNAGVKEGITNIENQPIAQGFITGQSAAVQKMADSRLGALAAQKIPLEQQLARAQARRQAALDVAKFRASSASERRKERQSSLKSKADQAMEKKKFDEDVRRYGLDYAQRERLAREKTTSTAKKSRPSQDDIDEGTDILQQQLRNSPDGYVNSGTYVDMYRAWVSNGGTRNEFMTYFPPNSYLNPNDDSVPAYLRPTGGSGGNSPY